MQPNSPNYDFILNPQKPPKQSLFGGRSIVQRVLIISVIALLAIILMIFVSSLLGKDGKVQKERLLALAQAQTEIIRVTAIASEKASDTSVKTLAATTRMTTESDKKAIITALTNRGVKKIEDRQLVLGKNTKSDDLLNEAITNNRFDETYKSILGEQLESYFKLVDQAKSGAGPNETKTLNTISSNVSLIAKSFSPGQ